MPTPEAKADRKRQRVLERALEVFAQYGFKRTTMADIASAAGISRPALYLMFENKEDLFRGVATAIQEQALAAAAAILERDIDISDRIVGAVGAYEQTYYGPVAASPHAAEITDINMSIAADLMREGRARLITLLAATLTQGERDDVVSLDAVGLKPAAFAELMMSAISGIKPDAASAREFQRKSRTLLTVFMRSISI